MKFFKKGDKVRFTEQGLASCYDVWVKGHNVTTKWVGTVKANCYGDTLTVDFPLYKGLGYFTTAHLEKIKSENDYNHPLTKIFK